MYFLSLSPLVRNLLPHMVRITVELVVVTYVFTPWV